MDRVKFNKLPSKPTHGAGSNPSNPLQHVLKFLHAALMKKV